MHKANLKTVEEDCESGTESDDQKCLQRPLGQWIVRQTSGRLILEQPVI